MKKNNFWLFTTICFFIICVATNFSILGRVFLAINGIMLLINTVWNFIKIKKETQK